MLERHVEGKGRGRKGLYYVSMVGDVGQGVGRVGLYYVSMPRLSMPRFVVLWKKTRREEEEGGG